MIRATDAGRTVVVKHGSGGTGQILLADGADFSLDNTDKYLLLKRVSTTWEEVLRSYGNDNSGFATYRKLLPLGGGTLTGRLNFKKAGSVASAATCDISGATGNLVHITGVAGISAFTMAAGQIQEIIFDDVLTLTHHATNNKLITGANFNTAAGDRALYWYDGTTVRMLDYTRVDGTPLAGGSGGLQIKMMEYSWDTSTSGSASITGVGFQPTHFHAFFNQANVVGKTGVSMRGDSVAKFWGDYHAVSANTFTGGVSIAYANDGTNIANLTFTSFDSDGMTFTRNKTAGSPTGTLQVELLFFRQP